MGFAALNPSYMLRPNLHPRLLDALLSQGMTTQKSTSLPFALPLTVEVARRCEHNSKPLRGNVATNRSRNAQ
jgi:hypothetical protein